MTESFNEEYIAAVAHSIRSKFVELKSEQLNKPHYKVHPSSDKPALWQKAALQCIKLKAEPDDYVRACFDYCSITRGPFPNSLVGPAAKKWYGYFLQSAGTKGVDEQSENVSADMVKADLIYDIKAARQIMTRVNGSSIPDKQNLDWICAAHVQLKPHVRALLGYPDNRIRKVCGEEAYKEFTQSESLRTAAKSLGYPVDKIIKWL